MENSKQEIVFLFGAGASVDAGVPDTYSFTSQFQESIKEKSKLSELLWTILKILEKTNEKNRKQRINVDVEQLLDSLRRLIEREKDQLLEFYDGKKFLIECTNEELILLMHTLENFIREKVIIKDEKRLDYLKELLKFEKPIEIFSTNYDTCIEQLSYTNHMRYTDGFDIYWNSKNFETPFDFLHYKMHGSVIWFENERTKECVKIPVHSFVEGRPIELKLIYGENVQPLIIYPAQKSEYIEPLTELQLMFKQRLCDNSTKVLIVVGYSFRDNYIVHMIWDAARVNEDLTIVIISPNAQQIFESKLKYINQENNSLSRIADRVICLPYPFCSVIKHLKNQYLSELTQIRYAFQNYREDETCGKEPNWDYSVKLSIDAEYSTLTEELLNRSKKEWNNLNFGSQPELLLYGFKALLHSIICSDGYEEKWLSRVNQMLAVNFSIENLRLNTMGRTKAYFSTDKSNSLEKMIELLRSLIDEKNRRCTLLTPKFENALGRLNTSLNKFEEFQKILEIISKGIDLKDLEKEENETEETKNSIEKLKNARQLYNQNGFWNGDKGEPSSLYLEIEKNRLKAFLDGNSFQFKLNSVSISK
ncbi:MAG: SIR2 family protein [Candidatus Bathyarchaeia archaeon]